MPLPRSHCTLLGLPHPPSSAEAHGKIERFHRTMATEWAFARHYKSEQARQTVLPGWSHTYNHNRQHSAIGRNVPLQSLDQGTAPPTAPSHRFTGYRPPPSSETTSANSSTASGWPSK
ncbi:integrase core domain-containing protein [Rhodococcus sp. NPDC058505]|uniref:integrase core domain-containing protein n=1 Tax=unclassified Rhodococcus (in: high G+C Gram-positive bacteria) TaxID=192944 RepID=UPI00364A3856